MGAQENNAVQTLTLASALAFCVFLSAPTPGWGQNTSDPFAPNYIPPSEPIATPKAPAPTAAPHPTPVKTAPVIEETARQVPRPPAPKVRATPPKSTHPAPPPPALSESTQPINSAQPAIQTGVSNDPFDPASIIPDQPTVTPTSAAPLTTTQPDLPKQPKAVTENQPQADPPSLLDRLINVFSQKENSEPEPSPTQPVVQKIEQPHTEPKSEPAPEARKPAHEKPGFFEQIGNALTSPFSSEEQDEKELPQTPPLSTKQDSQPAPDSKQNNETAKETPPEQIEPQTIDPRLRTARLGLGKDILLGQGDDQLSKQAKCFTKNRGTVAFCTTPTRWPDPIARHFQVSTHLYKDVRGIIKYDGAIATRLYAIFDSDGFNEVVQYFENQYGPATNTFNRHTRLLKENIDNKSYIWRRSNPDEGLVEVMEIRQFSDMRGPRPDLGHSTIRLYFEGSREIFTMTSDLDFMHLR